MPRTVSRVKPRNTPRKNLLMLRKLVMQSKMRIGPKGVFNRRILIDAKFGAHDYILHATKGYRRRRRTGLGA